MTYVFQPSGVCPSEITIEIDDNNSIQSVNAIGYIEDDMWREISFCFN